MDREREGLRSTELLEKRRGRGKAEEDLKWEVNGFMFFKFYLNERAIDLPKSLKRF